MKTEHGPHKHKHLEMIQGVINRLASKSFSIKQWTVMLVVEQAARAAGY